MEFDESKVDEFLQLFSKVQPHIAEFAGCNKVELKRDSSLNNVFYTHSVWSDESALESYRKSDFFKQTWAKTKKLFGGKPLAFSLIEP
jgi:quinol monooxygenase YgiN